MIHQLQGSVVVSQFVLAHRNAHGQILVQMVIRLGGFGVGVVVH